MNTALPEALLSWMRSVNNGLAEVENITAAQESDLSEVIRLLMECSVLQGRLITILEDHNARLTALEVEVEQLRHPVMKAPQIEKTGTLDLKPDEDVAEYNEWENEGGSFFPARWVVATDLVVSDNPAFIRAHIQRLFER